MAAQPSSISITFPFQFVSSRNPTSVHSISLSRAMIKMLNGTSLALTLEKPALVTSFQLDLKPLITTLRAQQSSQFFTHLATYPSRAHLLSLATSVATSILWKTVLTVLLQISNLCNSPFIHRASHFIIEGNQVGQGWFDIDKSLLADSTHLSVLHVPETRRTYSLIFAKADQVVGLPSWLFKILMWHLPFTSNWGIPSFATAFQGW